MSGSWRSARAKIRRSARAMLWRRSGVRKKLAASSSAIRCSSSWSSSPLVAGRPAGSACPPPGRVARRLEPLVGDQQHRLGEVEREEGRVDRDAEHGIGQHELVVGEPGALGAEQEARAQAGGERRARLLRRGARADHGLGELARARGRGVEAVEVGRGVLDALEQRQAVEHLVGARGGGQRLGVRPAALRPHEAQLEQAEVEHRARRGADVLAELRAHQDHDRRLWRGPPVAAIQRAAAAPSTNSL